MTVDGRVGIKGKVSVAGAMTTINAVVGAYPSTTTDPVAVTSPTRATLALTELVYDNSLNGTEPNNNLRMTLGKITVGSNGTCHDVNSIFTPFRRDGVQMGASASASLAVPIMFKSTGGKRYCIGALTQFSGTAAGTSYPASVTIGAYVVAGRYSGTGLATTVARTGPSKLHVNR